MYLNAETKCAECEHNSLSVRVDCEAVYVRITDWSNVSGLLRDDDCIANFLFISDGALLCFFPGFESVPADMLSTRCNDRISDRLYSTPPNLSAV